MTRPPHACDIARYHADAESEASTLSASIASLLVAKSPAHAWLAHPRLGGGAPVERDDDDKAQRRGTLLHAILLGRGEEMIVTVDAPDWRTKAAQLARDEAREAGKTPVLAKEWSAVQTIADRVRSTLRDRGVLLDGASEQAVYWSETADDGTEVPCRGLLDHWHAATSTIYDVKTCRSAHPLAIRKHVEAYGYDMQAEAYTRGVMFACGLDRRPRYVWIFCEMSPPYPVTLATLAPSLEELGGMRWRRAVNLWSECTRTGKWPEYAADVVQIDASPYALQGAYEVEDQ